MGSLQPVKPDRRSSAAECYRAWYKLSRWRELRRSQLSREPLCRMCQAESRVTAATVCDHIEPHKGSADLFWHGPFQSLCKSHHDGLKQSTERRGYSRAIGADGWPVDDRHPAVSGELIKRWGYSIPDGVQPSAISVMLVYGPPASGKSSYVSANAAPRDTVIDLDECKVKVGGRRWDNDSGVFHRAMAYRDAMIRGLADKRRGRAWLIVSAPTDAERATWARALGPVTLVPVLASLEDCLIRLGADAERRHARDALCDAARNWWHQQPPGGLEKSISSKP